MYLRHGISLIDTDRAARKREKEREREREREKEREREGGGEEEGEKRSDCFIFNVVEL